MARQRLRARFFVATDGFTFEKDRPVWPTLRRAIFDRDQNRCQYCGVLVQRHRTTSALSDSVLGTVDHVFPISRGGRTHFNNLILACQTCNFQKGAA